MADEEFETGRYTIQPPQSDDDAASSYAAIEDQREDDELERWMREDEAGEPDAVAGADQSADGLLDDIPDGDAPSGTSEQSETEPAAEQGGFGDLALGAIKDVGGGLMEAVPQVMGGAVDALDEAAQFMEEVLPLGTIQLYDPETGEFDLEYLTGDEGEERLKIEDSFFDAATTADADTVTGGFIRSTSQFLVGFLPALKGAKALKVAKGSKVLAPMAAGAVADAVVFDPNEDRLSTWLNEVPALEPYVSDYLADTNPDNQSNWEGRLKNAIEGAGLGLTAEGAGLLFKSLKYYKAQRAAKKQADPVGAQVEAGKDIMKEAAREELVQDVPDEAIAALGDPDGPMIIDALPDENAATAFQRVKDASVRSEQAIERNDALGVINGIRERIAAQVSPEAAVSGRDPMDDLIDAVRSGKPLPNSPDVSMRKRPAADAVKAIGGVKPKSSLAAELKARGITSRTHPGMFKKDGVEALDNLPASEHSMFDGRDLDDGAGYILQDGWLDALEAEVRGEPFRSPVDQQAIDEFLAPVGDFDEQLSRLGIDVSELSNASVKERISQIADEEDLFRRSQETVPENAVARSADDALGEGELVSEADGVEIKAEPRKIMINHARLKTADDVKAVLQEMIDADADAINAKRSTDGSGIVTNAETKQASEKEYREISDLIGRDPGPMTAAQSLAARNLLTASGEQLVGLARSAQAPDASKADIYNFRRAMAVHYAIQSEVVAARTETARALQAWAIPAGAGKARSQAINDLIVQSGGVGDIQSLAKAVSTVGDNPTALNTMARELGKGRFGRAMYQVWINGLLSSPKTHVVNITSNAMVSLWAVPERYLAAGISKAFYGGEIESGEVAAQAFGLVKGIRDGARLVYMGNRAEGKDGIADVFDSFAKQENYGNDFSAEAFGLDAQGSFGRGIDMMGKIINAPGSALQVEDKFFKSIGYRMELNALAYRTAAGEGLEGEGFAARVADILNNPPENLKAEALDAAHYQTFTNELGKVGQSFQEAIRKIPGARLVVPFIRTPTNIIKYTFERTPLAYMSGRIRSDIAAGGARAAQAHGRVAMGSMVMMTIMDMTAEDTITGRGPLDPALRRAKMETGWMPYSVKVGDRWYQYSRTDPIGMIVGLGADMAEIGSNANGEDADLVAMAGVVALANNLASKTYTRGIYDFIGAIDPSNPTNNPGRYVANFAGSMVPYSSFLRNVAGANDTIYRDGRTVIRGDDEQVDEIASYLEGLVNQQKKLIPGLSDELPPARDLFGGPIDRASGIGWAWDLLSPIASRVDSPDPVVQAIMENKVKISRPPRIVEGVRLNGEEYSEFSRMAGEPLKDYLDQLIASPGFDQMSGGPDGMKAELIRDAVNMFRERARIEIMQSNPRLQELSFLRQAEKIQNLQGVK